MTEPLPLNNIEKREEVNPFEISEENNTNDEQSTPANPVPNDAKNPIPNNAQNPVPNDAQNPIQIKEEEKRAINTIFTDEEIVNKRKEIDNLYTETNDIINDNEFSSILDQMDISEEDREILRNYLTPIDQNPSEEDIKKIKESETANINSVLAKLEENKKNLPPEQQQKVSKVVENIKKIEGKTKEFGDLLEKRRNKEDVKDTLDAMDKRLSGEVYEGEKIPPQLALIPITAIAALGGGIIFPAVALVAILKILPMFTKKFMKTGADIGETKNPKSDNPEQTNPIVGNRSAEQSTETPTSRNAEIEGDGINIGNRSTPANTTYQNTETQANTENNILIGNKSESSNEQSSYRSTTHINTRTQMNTNNNFTIRDVSTTNQNNNGTITIGTKNNESHYAHYANAQTQTGWKEKLKNPNPTSSTPLKI